ncbi:MAG: hypothetical protein ACE5KF_08810 [Kiloniellaceae bacterium]
MDYTSIEAALRARGPIARRGFHPREDDGAPAPEFGAPGNRCSERRLAAPAAFLRARQPEAAAP